MRLPSLVFHEIFAMNVNMANISTLHQFNFKIKIAGCDYIDNIYISLKIHALL